MNQGKKRRGLVDRKLVKAPSNFIVSRPKSALLFLVLLVILDVARCYFALYINIKIGKNSCLMID